MNFRLLTDSTLLVGAAFYGVMLAFSAAAGFFGVWLGILLLVSLWRFAYMALRATARGRRRIEAPGLETLNPAGEWRLFAHFIAFPGLVIVLVGVRPFGAEGIGLVLDWLAALAVVALLPASAALMGLTGNLEAAFRPSSLARVIAVFGRDYLTLAALAIGIVVAAVALLVLLPDFGFLSDALGNAIVAWAWLVTFALTGSLVREHRESFHVVGEVETPEERERRRVHQDWRRTLDLAYASLRSGLVEEGYETLRRLVAENGDTVEIHYWLVENMLEWENRSHALAVAQRLVERQVAGGELHAALELFTRCRRISSGFGIAREPAAKLAAYARSVGRHAAADELGAAGPTL